MGGNTCCEDILPKNRETEFSIFIESLTRDMNILIGDTLLETSEEQEIRECLETENFGFISQGIFDKNGVLVKTELLARLNGNNERTITPNKFLPIVEKIGYKTAFDYMVIEKAFEGIARANTKWAIRTRSNISYAINVNPTTFEDGQYFFARVDLLQRQYNIDPSTVIFEILESELIDDYTNFNKILSGLRRRGYKIAVDDFHPVGNHNMICIDNLHEIDTVKFDGVYMSELYRFHGKESVTKELRETLTAIVEKHPHIDIVIEKMENEVMFEFFRDIFGELGIENIHFQGYHFDKGSPF